MSQNDAGTPDDDEAAFDEAAFESAAGEAGHGGHDPYKDGSTAHQPTEPIVTQGGPLDAVKNFANTAALGAGPQIEGAIAALAQGPANDIGVIKGLLAGQTLEDSKKLNRVSPLETYRGVRDMGTQEHKASENTLYGMAAAPIGALATPIPIKGGATLPSKALRGGLVGFGTGAGHSLATAPEDLTTMDYDKWSAALKRAFMPGLIGAGGGVVAGSALAAAEPRLGSLAETQALRAAGLRGGIKNSVKKDLGLSNMEEARALGRQFLDEGLIPRVGSSEAVGKRAEALQGIAGNAKGSVLAAADTSGTKFDYPAMANSARARVAKESAVAEDMSGQKAAALADALERQGAKTPGSFVGADRAKSDAWKSANFADDAPMAAQLYRKSVGAARDDIERQVAAALGADKAATLNAANKKYGVAADALKLAENASTRDAAKKGFGMPEIMAMTTGAGAAGGHAMGHSAGGAIGGLALALGAKAFDKFGHSSAARASDWLARRAAANTGGTSGAAAANAIADLLTKKQPDPLEPYMQLIAEKKSDKP